MYMDSDGDYVVVESDEEFKEALVNIAQCKTFNLLGFSNQGYLVNSSPSVFTINMNAKILMNKNSDSSTSNTQARSIPNSSPNFQSINLGPLCAGLSNINLNPDALNSIINSVLQDTTNLGNIAPIVQAAVFSNFNSQSTGTSPQPEQQPTPETKFNSSDYHACFVNDVSIPDGTIVSPGEYFVKTWRFANKSNFTWPKGTSLVHVGGAKIGAEKIEVSGVDALTETEISVPMTAPNKKGVCDTHYRFVTPDGVEFGHKLWCSVKVCEDDSFTSCSDSNSEEADIPVESNKLVVDETAKTISVEEIIKESNANATETITETVCVQTIPEEPAAEEPAAEEPVAVETVVEEPAAEEPVAEEPVPEDNVNISQTVPPSSTYPNQIYHPVERPHEPKNWLNNYKRFVGNIFQNTNPVPPPRVEMSEEDLANKLNDLASMGFVDVERNTELLKVYNGDINGVVESLLQ